jgi:hypothetical protein
MAGPGQACMWCGRSPVTNEHLVPQWVSAIVSVVSPSDDGYDTRLVVSDGREQELQFDFASSLLNIAVKAVCTQCNSGWMNSLENEVRPVLGPLIRGEDVLLDVAKQLVLARWMAKTSVLVEHLHRGSVVLGPSDLEEIRSTGNAPIGYHMRLAYIEDPSTIAAELLMSNAYMQPLGSLAVDAEVSDVNAFAVTMSLGHFAVSLHGGPGVVRPGRWADGSHHPLMLWPPTPAGIRWPPAHPIIRSRAELKAFHDNFYTKLLNPDFKRPDALEK